MYNLNGLNRDFDTNFEKRFLIARLIACAVCLTLVNVSGYYNNLPLYGSVISLYMIYNLYLWAMASKKQDSKLFHASVYIDILMVSMLIAIRGGIRSDLYVIYFVALAYILSKKQKYLIISCTLMILLVYPAVCIFFTDPGAFSLGSIISRLAIRMVMMVLEVFILFNIKASMNYSSLLSQKAYEMALIDPLTKVYNRNMLQTLSDYRNTHPYCVSFAMIDVDDFKSINDTFGHQKGDQILSMLGELIQKNIRADDICIRYGGEEFLLAFKNTDNYTALKILDRIKSNFSEHIFYCDGLPIHCTISAGLALGTEKEDTDCIIAYADHALYEAKRGGKNNVIMYQGA